MDAECNGPKYPNMGICRISMLGVIILGLGKDLALEQALSLPCSGPSNLQVSGYVIPLLGAPEPFQRLVTVLATVVIGKRSKGHGNPCSIQKNAVLILILTLLFHPLRLQSFF